MKRYLAILFTIFHVGIFAQPTFQSDDDCDICPGETATICPTGNYTGTPVLTGTTIISGPDANGCYVVEDGSYSFTFEQGTACEHVWIQDVTELTVPVLDCRHQIDSDPFIAGCIVDVCLDGTQDLRLDVQPGGADNDCEVILPDGTVVDIPNTFGAYIIENATSLNNGIYTIRCQQPNGCWAEVDFEVNITDAPDLTCNVENSCTINGEAQDNGSITATPNTGTGNWTISPIAGTNNNDGTFDNLPPSTYEITYTDGDCVSTCTGVVGEDPKTTDVDCEVTGN